MDEHSSLNPPLESEANFPPSWALEYPNLDPVLVQEALSVKYWSLIKIVKLESGQFAFFDDNYKLSAIGTWDDLARFAEAFVPRPYSYSAPSPKKTVTKKTAMATLTLEDLGFK